MSAPAHHDAARQRSLHHHEGASSPCAPGQRGHRGEAAIADLRRQGTPAPAALSVRRDRERTSQDRRATVRLSRPQLVRPASMSCPRRRTAGSETRPSRAVVRVVLLAVSERPVIEPLAASPGERCSRGAVRGVIAESRWFHLRSADLDVMWAARRTVPTYASSAVPRSRGRLPTSGRPVDVLHEAGWLAAHTRTGRRSGPRCWAAHELGVGVAHVERVAPARDPQDRSAGKRVIRDAGHGPVSVGAAARPSRASSRPRLPGPRPRLRPAGAATRNSAGRHMLGTTYRFDISWHH
jgi:hypothetical protein